MNRPQAVGVEGAGADWVKLFELARARYVTLATDSHPEWRQGWLPESVRVALSQAPQGSAKLAADLLRRHGLKWPALSCWVPRICRVALLSREDAVRVFIALGLFSDPSLAYRAVNRQRVCALSEAVGPVTFTMLKSLPRLGSASTIDSDRAVTPSAVAEHGWVVASACNNHVDANMSRLMRLHLPMTEAPCLRWSAGARLRASRVCSAFFENVNTLIPEFQWLFGLALDS
jgi:hypothetical protein